VGVDEREFEDHLSQITTRWSMVWQAHRGDADAVPLAQRVLMERYGGAVYRYLLGALRDPDTAGELSQEFALRFLRGDFKRADPERGRFRDFLKTSVQNLITDHHRRRLAGPRQLPDSRYDHPDSREVVSRLEQEFLQSWRNELLNRAWQRLARLEEQAGKPFFTVLRHRAEHPDHRSAQMAGLLAEKLNKPLTAAAVRQTLHRAREKFADYLLDEVASSLNRPSPEQLGEELIALGLLEYCRPALERRDKGEP
jgi:RNA polymerase sigma-70 factor (ECF subfamily)